MVDNSQKLTTQKKIKDFEADAKSLQLMGGAKQIKKYNNIPL